MNKEQLIKLAQENRNNAEWTRFNYCQAWVSDTITDTQSNLDIKLIKSYNTIVGVAVVELGVVYELGKWSTTTSKQFTQICNQRLRGYKREFVQIDYIDRQKL